MNLPLKFARRYLLAKKSTNAINIITGISVFGIAVGTAALVLVLSVFNGFEDLITGLFSSFNPDIKVTPAEGKVFTIEDEKIAQIKSIDGVLFVSKTVEEVAFFENEGSQDFGTLKGVDGEYVKVTGVDSTIREGVFKLKEEGKNLIVMGVGMRNKLSASVDNINPINVYMAKRKTRGPTDKPFRSKFAYPAGTFVIQQDYDSQYVLGDLEFAQSLMEYKNGEIGAIEIKLKENAVAQNAVAEIHSILGEGFVVKDRYQQDEAFLKLMNLEKWMFYSLFSLSLILVAFNLIGSLWMIVIDKKNDISILKSMGAEDKVIRKIFLSEGFLLCGIGMAIGFFLAVAFYIGQKTLGIIPIPEGFIVDAYPISMRLMDFIVVGITVFIIGFLASYPPALRAERVPALMREG